MLSPPAVGKMRSRYLPLLALIAGSSLGGAALGIGVAGIQYALADRQAAQMSLAVSIAAVSLLALLSPRARRLLPQRRRQVSSSCLLRTRSRAAFRWGITLGTGFSTFVVTPMMYALPAIALVQTSLALAFMICVLYGFSRGLTIAIASVASARRTSGDSIVGLGFGQRLQVPLGATVISAIALLFVNDYLH